MQSILVRLVDRLPPRFRAFGTTGRIALLAQFIRFGFVGVAGLVVDTATVYALRGWLGLYGAGIAAYGTAATFNWLLNRFWTFRGQGNGAAHKQWARYLVANLAGFILNRGTYALMIYSLPSAAREPVLATAAGALVGLGLNFHLSRRMVFR